MHKFAEMVDNGGGQVEDGYVCAKVCRSDRHNGSGQVGQFVAPLLHPLIHPGLIISAQCIYTAMIVGGGRGQPSMFIDYNPLSSFTLE